MKVNEKVEELLTSCNITDEDIKGVIAGAEEAYENFLTNPDKEYFFRMITADATCKTLVGELRNLGEQQTMQEAKNSELVRALLRAMGLFAMLGVKAGFVKPHDKED